MWSYSPLHRLLQLPGLLLLLLLLLHVNMYKFMGVPPYGADTVLRFHANRGESAKSSGLMR